MQQWIEPEFEFSERNEPNNKLFFTEMTISNKNNDGLAQPTNNIGCRTVMMPFERHHSNWIMRMMHRQSCIANAKTMFYIHHISFMCSQCKWLRCGPRIERGHTLRTHTKFFSEKPNKAYPMFFSVAKCTFNRMLYCMYSLPALHMVSVFCFPNIIHCSANRM